MDKCSECNAETSFLKKWALPQRHHFAPTGDSDAQTNIKSKGGRFEE